MDQQPATILAYESSQDRAEKLNAIRENMKLLSDFFAGLGFRVQVALMLIVSLACFLVPAMRGARRAFSYNSYPTVQEEYVDWARWVWALLLIIASGKSDER